jgi:hypothetical protein
MTTRPLLLVVVLSTTAVASAGGNALAVSVSPVVSMAPATVRLHIHVEPHPDNRTLTVITESDAYYRGSSIPLEGEDSPPTVNLSYPNLPGGEYEVLCILSDGAGHHRATARAKLTVQSNS